MKQLSEMMARHQSLFRAEEWKAIDDEVVTTARAILQGRRVFAGATKVINNPGALFISWPQEGGDMSDAIVTLHGEDETQSDRPDTTEKILQIPIIQKDWELAWRLVEAAQQARVPLDTQAVAKATESVARTEEDHIATGKGGFKGLLNATGIDTMTGGAWSGTTLADWERRHNDISDAITELQGAGFYGDNGRYQVLISPTEAKYLRRVNGTAGRQVIADIEATIGRPFNEGVLVWSKVTAGKVYVRDPSRINADLVIGFDARAFELPKIGMNRRGRVMEAVVVRPKRPASIMEITVT